MSKNIVSFPDSDNWFNFDLSHNNVCVQVNMNEVIDGYVVPNISMSCTIYTFVICSRTTYSFTLELALFIMTYLNLLLNINSSKVPLA